MKKILSLLLALMMCLSLCACGEKHTHEWKAATCTDPKTCQTCGETEGVATGHSWKDATCTDPKTCKTCGAAQGNATGHDWKAATCTTSKTCKTCGETEGAVAGHNWKTATCTTPKTCKTCGKTEGGKGNHTYKEATCTTPKTCQICQQQSGSALGCTAGNNGKCIRCGKSMVKISDVLSKPMDSLSEISRFASTYYVGDCYYKGNFRFIFNSVNGVILSWGATNTSNKEIKYITFTVKYYNRVGDPAYDSITGKSSYTARMTGPIGAGKSFYFRGLIGYGADIYYGEITDMTITFMDGSTVSGTYGYTTWHDIRTGASPKECFVIEN